MYNPDYNGIENKGWVCAKCGRSLAPWKSECPYCNPTTITNVTEPQTIKITPFDDVGWWDNYVKNTSANSDIRISKNEAISWTGPAPKIHSEDEQSWRDWLDEMRATNRQHDEFG